MDLNDEIVISGIAGRYPCCNSFDEFKTALLDGIDLVTEDNKRFEPGTYNTPKRAGKINDVEYFDAGYFGISPRQADLMDPRHRIMFETVFEAIVDSGYNPKELRGSKTGVYVGIGNLDASEEYEKLDNINGYALMGTQLGQIANRTSYCFDFKGPSFVLDTACSTGLYAFTQAFKALESGDIDSAIVSAVHICFNPHNTREFNLLNMLSNDGKCKVFSVQRDGYVRSEAIVTVLLQRRSKCRRLYSTVLGAEVNCDGFKIEGITFPSAKMQFELMDVLYKKYKINVDDVSYVEMHGTGTPVGDISECQSCVKFFCQNRKEPLPIGAVKSNMGHSEISSGLCSLSKVLAAMETGVIPANLHCNNIDYSLPGLNTNRLKVITENSPWDGGIVSLNCFGFGGANSHIVLKSNEKFKSKSIKPKHRLVNVSGRTEESVRYYLDKLEKCQDDEECLALVDEIHKIDVEGHSYRGYSVLGENSVSQITGGVKKGRPIWFIYSGMGSQWTGMGKDLMKIDIFKNTIKKCARALKPYNIDLENVILSDDSAIFNDISNCFIAISAIEIALTDVLKSLGIKPDGFGGHSMGEVGCAYCNGELTPEQAVLIGYARGYATKRSKCGPGQMAAVGLGKKEILNFLPEGVYVACVNSSNSVTITGPQDSVKLFVQHLTDKGIFARLVNTANYAFHSKYLDDVSPVLQEFLGEIIKEPHTRSNKWISSSWKEDEWDNPSCKMNSSEYHCHNYSNPVLFDQVLRHIPKDAIVIEVAPHGLLTSILKKEMGPEVTILSLSDRNSTDNVQFLLSNIGKLFINGGQPNLKGLYNSVNYPVGRGTQNIGSLIKWDHTVKWFTPFFEPTKSYGRRISINTKTDEYSFLQGHNIDGRVLMAATGYLELVWKVVAEINSKSIYELPIIFESVKISRATVLPDNQDVVFWINIMKQSGYFEIFEGGSVCCSGTVKSPKSISDQFLNINISKPILDGYIKLKKHDVYKSFHLKKYFYSGEFQGIELVDVFGCSGKLRWNKNFTTFLDNMLQIILVPKLSTDLFVPTSIQKVVIDPVNHIEHLDENNDISVYYDKDLNLIRSGCIEILNLEVSTAPKKHIKDVSIFESQIFVPYITDNKQQNDFNLEWSVNIGLQIIIENTENITLKASEIVNGQENSLVKTIEKIIESEPIINVEFLDGNANGLDFILCSDGRLEKSLLAKLNPNGFVLFYGNERCVKDLAIPIVYQNSYNSKGIFLLRNVSPIGPFAVIPVNSSDFSWIEKVKDAIKTKETLYLVTQNDDLCGIVGLVKCINLEPQYGASVKCVFIQEGCSTQFNPESDSCKLQLAKKLTINILQNEIWGSYRHVALDAMNQVNVAHASNYIETIGDLSTFQWVQHPSHYYKSSLHSEPVYIFYSALNFKDVMIATGQVVSENYNPSASNIMLGFEYSGITNSNRRVMGISSMPSISLQVTSDPLFTWDVPTSWNLEEAATVPVVYATCYYAMMLRGNMKPNSSILIHAGAGGIGIAAISIALNMNCEVFTTCGSTEKKKFLLNMFPKLKEENIGNSRNTSFEQMVKRNTAGRGVDIVLNSLSADKFQASIRCVARKGQFLEIGKVDVMAGTSISSSLFAKNTTFHGVFLDDLFYDTTESKRIINGLVAEGITRGIVRPLPRTVFTEDKVEDAFRFLSTGKHKGKVLIQIRNESPNDTQSLQRTILAVPKLYFEPDKTYILIGGLGGFGLELTSFLIKRCARYVILNSRHGITNGYQSLCVKRWSEIDGVNIKINTDDTSSVDGAESLVKFAEEMGPVGGIFNMALVLQDALFINQTVGKFDAVFKSKFYSGANMDKISRIRCPKLDHFVVFSSIVAGRGNPGQSNYGMANSALERLCEKRRKEGLPGLAVQYGPIGDVGVLAEVSQYARTQDTFGLNPQPINSCINALEAFMLQPYAVGSTFVMCEQNALATSTSKTPTETVAHILGIRDVGVIDKNQSLLQIGLDSLMIAEIQQTFYRNFNIDLGTEEIRDLTFSKISQLFENSDLSDEKTKTSATTENDNQPKLTSVNAMLHKESVVEIVNDKSYTTQIFFLHPIEGNVEILVPLAKKLHANVYGLQSTKELDLEDLKTYAMHFIKKIKKIQYNGPYLLCGYSFGGALAFEIGVQLEKQNEKVNLFLIDGSPSFTKEIFHHMYEKGAKSETKSKLNILSGFLKTFDEVDYEQASAILNQNLSWEEQLKDLGEFVAKRTAYSARDVAISANSFKQRVVAGFFYEPSDVFNGQATLFRSSKVYKDLSPDYDLQKICKQPVNLKQLDGDHKSILLGDNLVMIAESINNLF